MYTWNHVLLGNWGTTYLFIGEFSILKTMTTTHNDIVCISFNSKSAHSKPPIYIYMQKVDSLSFPMLLGSGGCGLSLLNKICDGAKWLRLWFLWSFMWFENYVWCDLKLMFVTIPMYFSTIAKIIQCCDKLWFLGVSIVTRRDLQRSIVISLNLAIYCKSWWYTLQTYLRMNSVWTIKKDVFWGS